MTRRFKVRDLDGAIVGATTATALPSSMIGLSLRETGDEAVDAATHWWDGSGFALRTIAGDRVLRVVTDESAVVDLPEDAFTRLDHEPVQPGPRTISLTASAARVLSFTGKYAGSVTLDARSLADRRTECCAAVDASAEALRGKFITLGAGQAMTYQRKEAEARAWSVGADPASFPFLAGEATATGASIGEVAAGVIAAADQWARIGSAIEGARLRAKQAINDPAATLNQIETAAVIDWPARIDITAGHPA